MTIFTNINKISRSAWAEIVRKSPTGNWFYAPGMYEFFSSFPELFRPFVVGLYSPSPPSPYRGKRMFAWSVRMLTSPKTPLRQFVTHYTITASGTTLANNAQ